MLKPRTEKTYGFSAGNFAAPTLHIRFNGHSFDVPIADLEISERSSEVEIKHALSRYLGVGVDRFRDYRIDRHPTGNLTLRPHAVFG